MLRFLKQSLQVAYENSSRINEENIINFVKAHFPEHHDPLMLCDLGCGDGRLAGSIASLFPQASVHGVDAPGFAMPNSEGMKIIESDLNGRLPIESATYDLTMANQVIEHLHDTDVFLEEAFRITRPGGLIVISTENAASWHNIGATLLGWQPFSLTNISGRKGGVGNPFALHRDDGGASIPMQHRRLFTVPALTDLMAAFNGDKIRSVGAGYYPLPATVGRIEPLHAHFITVAAVRAQAG